MPGIFGWASQARGVENAGLFTEMGRRLKHHAWYQEDRHSDPAAGVALGRMSLGIVNQARQPAHNEDRSLWAVMDGEIYNYGEQRRELSAAGHVFHGDSQAELLLHGLENEGRPFFRKLHGRFAAAIWDAGKRQLILVNDRFGMRPVYFAKLPGRLLVGSEIKALLADPELPRTSNARGIAQFFTFGHFLAEDTLLEAVRLLPAAGWLLYDAEQDRLTLESYGRHGTEACLQGLGENELLDRLDLAFKQAVDRRVDGASQLGISLSGGLDARTILAVMDRGQPVTAVSIGVEGGIDHRSADQMAKIVGCPHHRYVLDAGFLERFEDHLRHMVHLTDGHYLSQCIVMPTLPFYRDLGIGVLLRGHAGELMHMTKAYSFSLDGSALAIRDDAGLEDWLYKHLHAYLLEGTGRGLFAGGQQSQMEGLARESLRGCLAESAGTAPALQRIWHLFISQRLRRETATSLVKFGSMMETRLPYLDNDLIDLLLAMPPELKLGDRIQKHILRNHLPAFLDVVNANTGTRLGAGPWKVSFAKARLRILSKLGVRGYQPYERLGLWLRRELRPVVRRLLLGDRCLERGIFEADTVRTVVEDHFRGRRNHTYLLMAMMIFELGQQQFIDGSAPAAEARGSDDRSSLVKCQLSVVG